MERIDEEKLYEDEDGVLFVLSPYFNK